MATAIGIPDRADLGDLSKLRAGLVDFVIQHHKADKAGPHFDVRLGTPDTGLYSWATKHELPEPGDRRALFRQPLHTYEYAGFQGRIPSGYGKGTVATSRRGDILVTSVSPDKIEFTTADKKYPERFVLLKPKTWKDKDWLLINNTQTGKVPYDKVRYKKIPAEDVDKAISSMQSGDTLERKLDGASSLVKLMESGVELLSYRTSKQTDRPITHTERFFGGSGKMPIPKQLVGTVLKGELYGSRNNEMIPPQELGGILNSTLSESLRKQKDNNVVLRNALYDIQQLGRKRIDWHKVPRLERRKMLAEVLQSLPQSKFELTEAAETPENAAKLWRSIQDTGYSPSTEGVVYWPLHGTPSKSKLLEDKDVYITGTFPGSGKYTNKGVGGFTYGLEPNGKTVGRLGTGLDDALRSDAFKSPADYVGRVARIKSQHQYPSGAWRAPSLIAFHEDYPSQPQEQKSALAALGASAYKRLYNS